MAVLLAATAALGGAAGQAWAAAGDLDSSFGVGGLQTEHFPTDACPGLDHGHAMAIQPDGKIVVVGYGVRDLTAPCDTSHPDFVVVRLNPNGTLDDSFGDPATVGRSGWTTTDFRDGSYADRALAVAIQDDGKIVVAGSSFFTTASDDFGVARYNTNGTLDTSFGAAPGCSATTPGTVTTNFPAGSIDSATDIAIQSDDKIVVVGYTLTGTSNFDFALTRYDTGGCVDTAAFNSPDGRVVQGFPAVGNDLATSVVIQSGGKIVVAGRATATGGRDNFALARFNSTDGMLDTSFGSGGFVLTDFGGSGAGEVANDVALQSDGKIVAAGSTYIGSLSYPYTGNRFDFALARYSADGVVDSGFGNSGKVTTDFAHNSFPTPTGDIANGLAIQADDKIVAGGQSCCDAQAADDFALARYSADGVLDSGFGSGGLVTTGFSALTSSATNSDAAYEVALQSDGKIVAAGTDLNSTGESNFALARYGDTGGTVLPPPESSPTAPAALADISNAFGIAPKPKLNKKKGTATLNVEVPGPGSLTLAGKGVLPQRISRSQRRDALAKAVAAAGTVALLVKPNRKTKKKLSNSGKASVTVKITFTPTGGQPSSQSKTVKLVKKP